MPTKLLGGLLDAAPAFAAGVLEVPVSLFGEMDSDPAFHAGWRTPKELAGSIENPLTMELFGNIQITNAFGAALELEAEFAAAMGEVRSLAGAVETLPEFLAAFLRDKALAGTVDVISEFAGALEVPYLMAGAVEAGAEFAAGFGFTLPALDDPLPGELAGVVNLARNPSVELDLTDWSGTGLARVVDGTAWIGEAHATWTVGAGVAGAMSVTSLSGLRLPGGASWGAVVALDVPEGVAVTTTLEALHTDVSVASGEEGLVEATGGWLPVVVPAVATTPGKEVDLLLLLLEVDNTLGVDPVTIRVDGVQFAAFGPGAEVYADGDQGEGHAWVGVPHRSPSLRQPGAA